MRPDTITDTRSEPFYKLAPKYTQTDTVGFPRLSASYAICQGTAVKQRDTQVSSIV